jgi:hypothetical protein
MTTAAPASLTVGADTAVTMLTALAAALDHPGLRTRLVIQVGQAPSLTVTSTDAPDLREDIRAAPAGGTWDYWWSWGEPIDPDPATAATRIRHVLRAAPGQ